MKINIAGAGAMGARFGVMLHQAGYHVHLIDEWKEHVIKIQQNGLEVWNENGRTVHHVPISFPEQYEDTCDLFIIITKTMQTKRMMKKCQHMISEKTKVLTMQNGLGNLDLMKEFVNENNIFAGVTTYAARLRGPAQVDAYGSGNTELMQISNQKIKEAKELVEIFNHAGMNATLSRNIMESIWKKVAFNSILNPLCTLTQSTVAAIGRYKNMDCLLDDLIDEIVTVAKAEKINLNKEEIKQMIRQVFDPSMSGHHYSSMYHDIKNGRKTEIDYLNGAIINLANKHQIDVPNHQLIYHLVCMLEENSKNNNQVFIK